MRATPGQLARKNGTLGKIREPGNADRAAQASFAFAWVMDEGTDERERGVTIDVCVPTRTDRMRKC